MTGAPDEPTKESDDARKPERRGPRFRTILIVLLLVGAALYIFVRVPPVFLYTFFALLVGVLLQSGARLVARSGLPYAASLALVVVAVLGLFVGFGFGFGPTIAAQVEQIADRIPTTLQNIEERLGSMAIGRELMERVPVLSQEVGEAGAAGATATDSASGGSSGGSEGSLLPEDPLARLVAITGGLVSMFSHIFYVVIIGVFLAATPQLYRSGIVGLFRETRRDDATRTLDALYRTLRAWLAGQLVAMLFVGIAVTAGLALLGVPFAFALGFIAFLFEFIPTIGPWIAGIPAVLVAFTQSPVTALWVALLFVAIELVEGNVLLPLVYQQAVELPPALTLFAIFLMGSLFGFVGVLVAAPLAATAVTLVRELYLKPHAGGGADP